MQIARASLLTLFAVMPLFSCGPQYTDVDLYPDNYSYQDGKNLITLESVNYEPGFSCVVKMDVQEDEYYLWDIKEIARITNLDTNLDYSLSVSDDVNMIPFPMFRERTITFSNGRLHINANPFSKEVGQRWVFSFRYRAHRFLFHLEPPSEI